MRDLRWHNCAWDEYVGLQENKRLLKRTNNLIKDIRRNGYATNLGKPELLKGDLSGFASVRIDKKNRLVFCVDEKSVTIVACGEHYSDK